MYTPLSSEQIEHCRFKNAEVNRSLGLSPEQDPSEDKILDFDGDETLDNYFSEVELAHISKKNQTLDEQLKQNQSPSCTDEKNNQGDMDIDTSAAEQQYRFISEVEMTRTNLVK